MIILKFDLMASSTSCQLRINLASQIRFPLTTRMRTGRDHLGEQSVELATLRKRSYPRVTYLLTHYIDTASRDCPQLWVNGLGRVWKRLYSRTKGNVVRAVRIVSEGFLQDSDNELYASL